jgi:hypothetical protein
LSHLYPRYVRAFEGKCSQYLPELRNNAEILELGSHLGAFLQTAEEWGWRPTGLDIGESTCAFARNRRSFPHAATVIPQTALNLPGYNNLLGFPYLHGYTPATLDRFLRAHRFDLVATYDRPMAANPPRKRAPANYRRAVDRDPVQKATFLNPAALGRV